MYTYSEGREREGGRKAQVCVFAKNKTKHLVFGFILVLLLKPGRTVLLSRTVSIRVYLQEISLALSLIRVLPCEYSKRDPFPISFVSRKALWVVTF